MASTAVMTDNKVSESKMQVVAPSTSGLGLGMGMLALTVFAAAWAGILVGIHFLQLRF